MNEFTCWVWCQLPGLAWNWEAFSTLYHLLIHQRPSPLVRQVPWLFWSIDVKRDVDLWLGTRNCGALNSERARAHGSRWPLGELDLSE